MRRKIEITPDGQSYTDSEPGLDVEEQASERDNSVSCRQWRVTRRWHGGRLKLQRRGRWRRGSHDYRPASRKRGTADARRGSGKTADLRAGGVSERQSGAWKKISRQSQKYATGEFIKNLLPVLDNFERALKAAEQTQNYDALIGGVNGTLKQLLSALQKAGITPIEAVGQEFDPNYHEAIGHTESDEFPANTVAEELQRGYIMHDRVLRPTLVKVAQG